jgi:hypothetical protein
LGNPHAQRHNRRDQKFFSHVSLSWNPLPAGLENCERMLLKMALLGLEVT